MKKIEVRAARTQDNVLNHQCDVVNEFDTVKNAKETAKYYLTDRYQKVVEASEPLTYAAVYVNDECIYDYFRK